MKKIFRSAAVLLLSFAAFVACHPEVVPPVPADPSAADSVTVSMEDMSGLAVSDILGEELSSLVHTDASGDCSVSFAGPAASVVIDAMKDYDGSASVRRYCDYPISYAFNLGSKPSVPGSMQPDEPVAVPVAPVDLSPRAKGMAIYMSGLPEGLVALEDVELTPQSHVEVTLSFVDPWFTDGVVTPSFKVDMSHFFNSPDAKDGILEFDAPLTRGNGWSLTKSFRLSSVPFDPANYDAEKHNLKLDAAVALSGNVVFGNMVTTKEKLAGAPEAMQLSVTVVLRDMCVRSVRGRFNYASSPFVSDIDIAGILKDRKPVVNLKDARLTVGVVSTVPMAGVVDASAAAYMGSRSVAKAEGLSFGVEAAGPGSRAEGWGVFDAASSGAFSDLLGTSFGRLSVGGVVRIDDTVSGTLEVGSGYLADVVTMFEAPMLFSDGFSFLHSDTVSVADRVAGALREGEVRICGRIVNRMPLDLEVSLAGYAADGRPLTGVVGVSVPADGIMDVDRVFENRVGSGISALERVIVETKGCVAKENRVLTRDDGVLYDLGFVFHK